MEGAMEKKKTLWTHDFTIITLGSFISMLGNSISGFAIGLLVLDYTKSTMLYAIYMFLYTFPRIVMPVLAGPFLDKFSRKKTIYMLDFVSAAIYGVFAWVIFTDHFSFWVLAIGCMILGSIDSVYRVAYDSFYPMLISEGFYSKAYSIASILETLSAVVIPVSAFLYNTVGIGPLFLINAISFLAAAIMETRVRKKEEYSEKRKDEVFTRGRYLADFKEGLKYLHLEKGLLAITIYFMFSSFAGGVSGVLTLPYFKSNYHNGEYIFMIVWGMSMVGRILGGSLYYKFKYPESKKFNLALFVYISMCIIEGIYLFTPVSAMQALCFMSGILGVTSYNIRISSTQSYIPDERKGRYNGTFEMLNTFGMMLGQLVAGGLSVVLNERIIILGVMMINMLAAIFIMGGNRKHVSKIYNRTA